MSEVKEKTPATDSKKEVPNVEEKSKEKIAGPTAKADDPKKELSKVEEASKDDKSKKVEPKTSLGEIPTTEEAIKQPKPDDAKLEEPKPAPPEKKPKHVPEDVTALTKSITAEFAKTSALFASYLDRSFKAINDAPEAVEKLKKANKYYRTMEAICKAAHACAKDTFAQVTSTFEEVNGLLTSQLGIKDVGSSLIKETAEVKILFERADKELKAVFEKKVKDEVAQGMKGYETVTMKGLDTEAEHRLLSANYSKKSLGKESGSNGAAERSKVKREVAAGVYDKVFVGYKNLSVAMAVRRDKNSDKTAAFGEYRRLFELKSQPDVILKGMGTLE
jgi:hypothetical protein